MNQNNLSGSNEAKSDGLIEYGSMNGSKTGLEQNSSPSDDTKLYSNGNLKDSQTSDKTEVPPSEEKPSENGHTNCSSGVGYGIDLSLASKSKSLEPKPGLVRYSVSPNGDKVKIDDTVTMQISEKKDKRDLTDTEAVVHLFKVFTGPSTIGMPAVMKKGGLVFGTLGFLFIGYLATYGNILIVNCGRLLCKRTGCTSLRYEELMELTILSYSESKRAKVVARIVRLMTVFMLCMCQFGILAFYIQVVGTVLEDRIDDAGLEYGLPLWVTKLFICLSLIPYSWMRNLKVLSWFSLFANISILVCIATIFQYSCSNLKAVDEVPWVTKDVWSVPLFISASVFTVEGVPMVLPIENRVKHPENYGGPCGIITFSATANIVLNTAVGFYGYLSQGDSVPDNILTALPSHWWYNSVSLLLALVVFLTFTLQLFLPAEFAANTLKARIKADWFQKYAEYIVRTLFVIAAYLFGLVVTDLELIMSLTGAFCSVPLLFLFPGVGEILLTRQAEGKVPVYMYIKNGLIFLLGIITCLCGGFMSVLNIIEDMS